MIFFKIIWLILPAGIANIMACVSAKIFPQWNYPVDLKQTFKKKRIFGDNKTFRGLIAGVFAGSLIFVIQKVLFDYFSFFQNISLIDYKNAAWMLGIFMSLGALIGDLAASFFKRQLNKKSGESWFLIDQIDWIIGFILLTIIFARLSFVVIFLTLILGIFLHIVIKFIGYLLKIDKRPI